MLLYLQLTLFLRRTSRCRQYSGHYAAAPHAAAAVRVDRFGKRHQESTLMPPVLCARKRSFNLHSLRQWLAAAHARRPHLHIQELKRLRPVAGGSRSSHPAAQPAAPSSERAGPVALGDGWDNPWTRPYHPAQPALERSGPVARHPRGSFLGRSRGGGA